MARILVTLPAIALALVWAAPIAAEESEIAALNPIAMAIGLLGGLALFLYGMEKMTDGLKAAAGEQMKILLGKLTRNAVSGALTGALVTAVIQSSSVTTVLVVGFVSAGLMTLVQSVGVIFGANVGTTMTAQIVAFNVTAAALPLIIVGFGMNFIAKEGKARHYGNMFMGLGLIFYGMAAMGEAMSPLRSDPGFIELMQSMERPLLGMLVGALFTALVQSSSATIGLAVVMATQGLVTLPAGIAIVFGAKIGTCITALLAAMGKPRDALRAAAVHVLYNLLGALLWVAFIDQLAALAIYVSPEHLELEGEERMLTVVPRQIANAATIWATANMIIFLPFAGLFATMARKLVPDKEVVETTIVQPRFLDESVIQVPALALERARMEMGHMADCIREMTDKVIPAFQQRDPTELMRLHDCVVILRTEILDYLQLTGRQTLTDEEAEEHSRLVYAIAAVESLSTTISQELGPLARAIGDSGFTVSEATGDMLRELYVSVKEMADKALTAIVDLDERVAQEVIAQRGAKRDLGLQLLSQQAQRLAMDDPDRLRKHRFAVDMLDKLRRMASASEHLAMTVLPSSVIAGELAVS